MKRIWELFLSFSRSAQIGVAVLITHAALLFALLIHHGLTYKSAPKKAIAIRTTFHPKIEARQSTPIATSSGSPKQVVAGNPKPKVVALPKAKPTTQPVKKQPTASPKQETYSEELKELTDSFEALFAPTTPKRSNFSVELPKHLEMQTQVASGAPSYGEAISAFFQSNLLLPEFGDVVARIEVDASGNVIQCEILSEKSRKNAEFLKKRLQELALPCFNEFHLVENRLQFTITFSNVENR